MIITLTLNPAIDKTLTLETFDPQKMNRALQGTHDPGGKGINVSKVVKALSGKTLAMGIVGGTSGNQIKEALRHEGILADFIHVPEETRTNLKIFVQDSQETIEINEAGPVIHEAALWQLKDKLFQNLEPGTICVVAGSVPQGVDRHIYKDIMIQLKYLGAKVIFDADGDLFKHGILAKPDYIKPNLKELEAYFGKTIETDSELMACAQDFLDMGIKHVVFSLGSEGAFYMDGDGAYRAYPLKVDAHSSVGAGDAFVGAMAYAIEQGYSTEEMLRLAIATSAGAVTTIGTKPAEKAWVDAHKDGVKIEKLA